MPGGVPDVVGGSPSGSLELGGGSLRHLPAHLLRDTKDYLGGGLLVHKDLAGTELSLREPFAEM